MNLSDFSDTGRRSKHVTIDFAALLMAHAQLTYTLQMLSNAAAINITTARTTSTYKNILHSIQPFTLSNHWIVIVQMVELHVIYICISDSFAPPPTSTILATSDYTTFKHLNA